MMRQILILMAFLSCGLVLGSRVKRHLVFSEGSRLFVCLLFLVLVNSLFTQHFVGACQKKIINFLIDFYVPLVVSKHLLPLQPFIHNVNIRDNLFDYSDFFAQVFGFKMDWDLPSRIPHGANTGRIQRRDLYQGIENFLHRQNLNGTSCIRKFLCEASVVLPKSNHFLAQFYEVIFSAEHNTAYYSFEDSGKDCTQMLTEAEMSECPLSLLSLVSGSESDFNIFIN